MGARHSGRSRSSDDARRWSTSQVRRLALAWAGLVVLALVHPTVLPADAGAATTLRSADPTAPPGPGDRTPSSGLVESVSAASDEVRVPGRTSDRARRPLPEPLGREQPGHRDRIDRPPRRSA